MDPSTAGPQGPAPGSFQGSVRAARERAEAGIRIPFQEGKAQAAAPSSKFARHPNGSPSPSSPRSPQQWPLSGPPGSPRTAQGRRQKGPSQRAPANGPPGSGRDHRMAPPITHGAMMSAPRLAPPPPQQAPWPLNAPRPAPHPPQQGHRPPGAPRPPPPPQQAPRMPNAPRPAPPPPQPAPQQSNKHNNSFSTFHDPNTPINPTLSTSSSRPTTGSSYDSISDYPPSNASNTPVSLQPRRPPALGPPPSARRGTSSYYSQPSYVDPIPEEKADSPRNMSYVSGGSTAQQSWSDGPPTYYTNGRKVGTSEKARSQDLTEDKDTSGSETEEGPGLVRQASLGKQYKPSLTTVRSVSTSSSDALKGAALPKHLNVKKTSPKDLESAGDKEMLGGGLGENTTDTKPVTPHSDSSDQAGAFTFFTPSDDSPDYHVKALEHRSSLEELPRTPPVDPRVEQILGGLEKGGALERGTTPPVILSPTASLRPDPLDVPRGPKNEASRGSMASLTDLIRRATRVRHNLDRGQTASRLGMREMLQAAEAGDNRKHIHSGSSLSAMLASFPPPGAGSPTPSNRSREHLDAGSEWPRYGGHKFSRLAGVENAPTSSRGQSSIVKGAPRRRRRCCGLSPLAFTSVMIILVLLITAAIVVPIKLIVIPRNNAAAAAATPTPNADPLSNCSATHSCGTNGASVVSANACSCVCSNAFTGADCSAPPPPAGASAGDCTMRDYGSYRNATLGADIPRLLAASAANFSVPLNATALLAAFSASKMSCSDENHLVTFSGFQRRSLPPSLRPQDVRPLNLLPRAPDPAAAPSDSPLLIDSAAATPTPTATRTGTSAASASATATAVASGSPEPRDVDFGRVAVLYVLQQAGLDTAAAAQIKVQSVLAVSPWVADEVSVKDGVELDFLRGRVTVGALTVGP